MQTVVTRLLLHQDGLNGNLLDFLVNEGEEIILFVVQSQPDAVVIRDRVKPNDPNIVIGVLVLLDELN